MTRRDDSICERVKCRRRAVLGRHTKAEKDTIPVCDEVCAKTECFGRCDWCKATREVPAAGCEYVVEHLLSSQGKP